MRARRFLLRLTVGLLCFALGWASALLLGATSVWDRAATPRYRRVELVAPHFDPPPPPPRFETPPAGPSCRGRMRARHAHEWHEVPRVEEFDLRIEVPPPPPRPRRPER